MIFAIIISVYIVLRSNKLLKSRISNWSPEKTYLMLQRWGINNETYDLYWKKRGIRTNEEVALIAKTTNVTFAALILVNTLHMSFVVFVMNKVFY